MKTPLQKHSDKFTMGSLKTLTAPHGSFNLFIQSSSSQYYKYCILTHMKNTTSKAPRKMCSYTSLQDHQQIYCVQFDVDSQYWIYQKTHVPPYGTKFRNIIYNTVVKGCPIPLYPLYCVVAIITHSRICFHLILQHPDNKII